MISLYCILILATLLYYSVFCTLSDLNTINKKIKYLSIHLSPALPLSPMRVCRCAPSLSSCAASVRFALSSPMPFSVSLDPLQPPPLSLRVVVGPVVRGPDADARATRRCSVWVCVGACAPPARHRRRLPRQHGCPVSQV